MTVERRSAPRRWTALAVAAAVGLLSVTGCSGPDDSPPPAAPSEPALVPGFDGAAIHVGVIFPASGPLSEAAAERAFGLRAYLDYATTELAGAGGRYAIQVEVRDSSDLAELDEQYAELRDRTVLLAQVDGQAALEQLLPALEDDGVLAAVSAPVAASVRNPNLLPVGVPIELVAANGLAWALDPSGGKGDRAHVCSVAQDGFETAAWQDGVARAAERLGAELPASVVVPRTAAAPGPLRGSVDRLRSAGCTTVMLDAGSVATKALLEAASSAGFEPRWVVPATSASGVLTDEDLAAYAADHVVTVGDGPTTDEALGQSVAVHVRDLYAPGQPITPAFTSGLLLGKVVVAVLDDAARRGDLSRRALLADAALRRSVGFDDLAPDARFGPPPARRPPGSSTIGVPDAGLASGLRSVAVKYSAPFAGDLLDQLLAP
jgi:ABC-type branched-subunit amino acid transport system substrate-binding protein